MNLDRVEAERLEALATAAPLEPLMPELIGRVASTVETSKPEWLWRGWLPVGSLVLLVGRQGAGKTTWTSSIIAHLTQGRPLPGADPRPPVKVGVMSLEEHADRVVARLAAAGADLDRVVVLDGVRCCDEGVASYLRPWRMPNDIGLLRQRIEADALTLVVIDGAGYSVASGSGEPGYAVVGGALSALAAVAASTGCAVLGLTHPPKGSSDPVTAAIGSTGWTAIPRVTWVLGVHPDDETRRVVKVGKTNYREPTTGWSFSIANDAEHEVGYVRGAQPWDGTAASITAATPSVEERTALDEAAEWLESILADGPCAKAELLRASRAEGITRPTLDRARERLALVVARDEHTRGRPSTWALPGYVSRLTSQTPVSRTPTPADQRKHAGSAVTSHGQMPETKPPDEVERRALQLVVDEFPGAGLEEDE